jgi:two-component system sensor histidine kinase/response regulator
MDPSSQSPVKADETILIVDDSLTSLSLLARILSGQGYRVRVANSGEHALESVQFKCPDLILLDIMMPGMDGFELCRCFKADEQTQDVPIIFLSALNTAEDKLQAFAIGGVDYVTKPFQPQEVLARVNTHISILRLQRELSRHNADLRREIAERRQVEQELVRYRDHLEELVQERTAELEQQRVHLQALAARLAEAEEAERRRLASELHDQAGQNLTALSMSLHRLRGKLPDEATARLEEALDLVDGTSACIRKLMVELRPPVLDDYGLMAALQWYGEQFSRQAALAVVVEGEETSPRLPPALEIALFRIVQEALNNILKHAAASRVTVRLSSTAEGIRLVVADDGIGFDPMTLQGPDGRKGWGLRTMRERAQAVGGQLRVESTPGQGTRVVIEILSVHEAH